MLALPSQTGYLLALTLHSPCISRGGRDWYCETVPLSVSYTRQDFIVLAVILAVTLYMRQPLFLMHSVHGDLLAMSWKTRCPFALTLHPRGLSSALCEVVRIVIDRQCGSWGQSVKMLVGTQNYCRGATGFPRHG